MNNQVITLTIRYAVIGIISLLLFTTLGSGATIQTTSVTLSGAGEQAEIPVTLDTAANGLAGYRITAAIAPEGIAEITSVTMPDWATLKEVDASLPAQTAVLTAVDLTDGITAGATAVPICTLMVTGVSSGTATLTLTLDELTDDAGNPVSAGISPATITVAAGTAPTEVPTALPTAVPTESSGGDETGVIPVPTDQVPLEEITPAATLLPVPGPTGTSGPIGPTGVATPVPTPVPKVVANFTSSVTTGNAPVTILFTDNSSGYPDTFLWNFGDGSSDNTSVIQNPQHTYRIPGVYTVSLTASNSVYSNTTTAQNLITVNAMKLPARDSKNTVTVYSVPDGAEVYLNNAYQGVTPVTIPNLTTKKYQLRLHKDGYLDVVDPVIINDGALPSVITGYELVPHPPEFGMFVSDPPQTGAAYIVSYPGDVDVYIDGGQVGTTDLMVMNLAVGTHNLTLVRDGFTNWTDTLDIRNALGVIKTYYYEQPYFPRNSSMSYVNLS